MNATSGISNIPYSKPTWRHFAFVFNDGAAQTGDLPEPQLQRSDTKVYSHSANDIRVLTHNEPVDAADVDFDAFVLWAEETEFIHRIERSLREDAAHLEEDETPPTESAIQGCLKLTRLIARRVVMAPGLKTAAFVEDTGTVSLVLQSSMTDRRLNLRIDPTGSRIEASRIDEYMQSSSITIAIDDSDTVREQVGWVIHNRD